MISIVDDDRSVREAANSLIRSLGYATATFASGEEFLESGCGPPPEKWSDLNYVF